MSDEQGAGYSQEDSYFHRKDQELLAKRRAQLDAHRSASAVSMKCPRCGAAMTEVAVEHVKIDRCTACGGVFLDRDSSPMPSPAASSGACSANRPT